MDKLEAKRQSLLEQMGEIETMHRGRLSEEYRERQQNGETIRLGPYYKYQEWKDGRNRSRRIKAEEVEVLREGIEGMDKFKALAADYIDTTVALTEQRNEEGTDSKKNSG
jgi:hypothetical protein